MSATQQVESILVYKQVIRADGTREPEQLAACMHRNPDEMERLIRDNDVQGVCDSGTAVISMLNSVPPEDAKRIAAINDRQARALKCA